MTELMPNEQPLCREQTPPRVVKDDSEMDSTRNEESEPAMELEEKQMFCQEDSKIGDDDSHKINDLEESRKESESPVHNEIKRDSSAADPDVKPTHSYIALIAMAILSCPNKKMILGDIYQYISDNFPYYRNKDKSWRNSIRHNLSLNECFIKAGRSENGKGNYWAIHPSNLEDFANGDFRRRRARRRVRRSHPLRFGGASSHSAYFRGMSSLSTHTSFLPYGGAEDYRMYPSLTYMPPTKKSFAIDSIIGSYDSSFLYSPASVRSYPSVALHSALDYRFSSGAPQPGLLFHSPPALSTSNSTYSRSSTDAAASAFSAYLAGSKAAPITRITNTRHQSWQETLTKLQEQLRKVTP